MKTLSKNQKLMLQIKNTVQEIKSDFDGLISSIDTTEERNCAGTPKLKSKEKN